MANQVMSEIERGIRDRAQVEAVKAFAQKKQELLGMGWPVSSSAFPNEDSDALRTLLDKYLNKVVIPRAQETAIRSFLGNYERLVVELPALQEAAYEEGREDAAGS